MWTEKWPQKRSCASPPRSSSSIPPKFTTKRLRAFAIGPPPVEPSSALNLLAIAGTEYGLFAALIWGRDHRRDHRSRNAAHHDLSPPSAPPSRTPTTKGVKQGPTILHYRLYRSAAPVTCEGYRIVGEFPFVAAAAFSASRARPSHSCATRSIITLNSLSSDWSASLMTAVALARCSLGSIRPQNA